jgi:hypothetical protein
MAAYSVQIGFGGVMVTGLARFLGVLYEAIVSLC